MEKLYNVRGVVSDILRTTEGKAPFPPTVDALVAYIQRLRIETAEEMATGTIDAIGPLVQSLRVELRERQPK